MAASPAGLAVINTDGKYQLPRHIRHFNQKLLDLAAGRITRLMIFCPPRHGKSELVSKYFPAWYVAIHPEHRVILSSYEADFAASWGRKARDLVTEWGPTLYGVRVRDDSSAANRWDLANHTGGMSTAGAGGPITGKGAHLFIIDDPIKNAEEALSPVKREHLWDWFQSTAYTRLEPGGKMVVTLTRWHDEDLAGRILDAAAKEGGEPWEVVTFPAIAEEDDVLGRTPGQPLWPERFDLPTLERIRTTLESAFWWFALYQQRPTPQSGTTFQRPWFNLRRYPSLLAVPKLQMIAQSVDSAFKEGVSSDYSVIATWGTDGIDLYLLGLWRGQVGYPDLIQALKDEYAHWDAFGPGVAALLIESKASGQSAIQTLRRETGLPVIGVEPDGSKVWRAEQVAPFFQGARVVLPEDAPWLVDWIDEHVRFPRGKHDDQVDTSSQVIKYLRRHLEAGGGITVGATHQSESAWDRRLRLAADERQPDPTLPEQDDVSLEHQARLARMLRNLSTGRL